jgi:predicted  nucleic acid-binding Zn-ribbon protein
MIETTKPGESDKTIRVRSAVKSRKDSTPDALEPFKALRKEMQQQFLGIDQQIQKFLTQGKDIQGRLSLLQEKIQSNQGMVQKYEE